VESRAKKSYRKGPVNFFDRQVYESFAQTESSIFLIKDVMYVALLVEKMNINI